MASIKSSAAVSHVGKIRSNNQDSGYAGGYLFLVADGMGGHAGGDVASALATKQIARDDTRHVSAEEAAASLRNSLIAANREITAAVAEHAELTGMGTTVSALLVQDDRVALAHIGDSRVYLLRSGELSQITTDHTFVQRLVDSGRITEEEAMVHPRRSVLMRVLGDVDSAPEIDTMILDTREGDRWLICSDGLSGVISSDDIRSALSDETGAKTAADRLVKMSLDGGAPDNVTVVVVDVGHPPAPATPPQLVGSAAEPLAFGAAEAPKARPILLAPFRHAVPEAHFEPDSDEYFDELIEEDRRRVRRRRLSWLVGILTVLAIVVFVALLAYQWTQSRYFVGESDGRVAIYQGIQQDLGPITLHTLFREYPIDVSRLRTYDQTRVHETINADSLLQAQMIVNRLESSVE